MTRTSRGLSFLLGSMVLATIVSIYSMHPTADPEESVRRGLIWTGRFAFFIYLLILIADPLRKFVKTDFSAKLRRYRREMGISYGGIQIVHTILIIQVYLVSVDQPQTTGALVTGIITMVLIMGMLTTSYDLPARLLGKQKWNILHRTGLHFCTFIYFYDFVLVPYQINTFDEYGFLAALLMSGLLLRTAAVYKTKSFLRANIIVLGISAAMISLLLTPAEIHPRKLKNQSSPSTITQSVLS